MNGQLALQKSHFGSAFPDGRVVNPNGDDVIEEKFDVMTRRPGVRHTRVIAGKEGLFNPRLVTTVRLAEREESAESYESQLLCLGVDHESILGEHPY